MYRCRGRGSRERMRSAREEGEVDVDECNCGGGRRNCGVRRNCTRRALRCPRSGEGVEARGRMVVLGLNGVRDEARSGERGRHGLAGLSITRFAESLPDLPKNVSESWGLNGSFL